MHTKTFKQNQLHTSESNTVTSKFRRGYLPEVEVAHNEIQKHMLEAFCPKMW